MHCPRRWIALAFSLVGAHAAEDLPMGAIAVFTETGNTARILVRLPTSQMQ